MPGSSNGRAAPAAGTTVTTHVSPAGVAARTPATILIVEDDPGTVAVFGEILQRNGYDVCVAPDAESGLREVERVKPSAVLLDLRLPLADGVEFLRQLRADAPQARMPIAVVTGDYFLEETVGREIQALGARVHFKPLWEEDLLKLVRELLDG